MAQPVPTSVVPEESEGFAEPPGSRPQRLLRYLALAGISSLGPFSTDMYLPALPALGRDFGAGQAATQLTITGFLVGMAAGQLLGGPISDAIGRRRPILAGLACYCVASLACGIGPSMPGLIALRFLQGLAGSSGLVIATATVRDLYAGRAAARFFSLLQLVTGLGPILAPVIGGQVLRFTDWRGIFAAQACIGLVLLVAAGVGLRETLPPERRRPASLRDSVSSVVTVSRDPSFLAYAVPAGLVTGVAFSYISGSSFVLQGVYGVSPQVFSFVFALSAVSLILSGQTNRLLLSWLEPETLLRFGLGVMVAGPLGLLGVIVSGAGSVQGVVVALCLTLLGFGFINFNALALALTLYPERAGSAAALVGILRFGIGAVAAPLAGLSGRLSATPMAGEMLSLGAAAVVAYLALGRLAATRSAVCGGDS